MNGRRPVNILDCSFIADELFNALVMVDLYKYAECVAVSLMHCSSDLYNIEYCELG